MDLQVQTATLTALLLGVVRAAAFVMVAPPFSGRLPPTVRAAVALSLSLVLTPHIRDDVPAAVTITFLITATVAEAVIGVALGVIVLVLFTAVQMAGDYIDMTGGFSVQPAFDPSMMSMNGAIGRLHYLLASTLLFTSGGHLILVAGFVNSYAALPVGEWLPTDQMASTIVKAFSLMLLAAAQIAGPLVAVLLLADIGLAILTRAAPALNMLTLGFPVKILITLLLLGLAFPLLPAAVENIVDNAVDAFTSLGAGGETDG